jgi:WD40 repeat protein
MILDVEGVDEPVILRGHELNRLASQITSVAMSPDSRLVITGQTAGMPRVWRRDGTSEPMDLGAPDFSVSAIEWIPTSMSILALGNNDAMQVLNAFQDNNNHATEYRKGSISASSATRDRSPSVPLSSGRVRKSDALALSASSYVPPAFEARGGEAMTKSPDGSRVAALASDGTIWVWSTDGQGEPIVFTGPRFGQPIQTFRWSPDGKRVAAAVNDETISVWRVWGDKPDLVLKRPQGPGILYTHKAVEWSPDGRCLATASHDDTIHIWLVDWADIHAMLWHSTNAYLFATERMEILGEDEATAKRIEAEDRAWIAEKIAAEREGRPLPEPPVTPRW